MPAEAALVGDLGHGRHGNVLPWAKKIVEEQLLRPRMKESWQLIFFWRHLQIARVVQIVGAWVRPLTLDSWWA